MIAFSASKRLPIFGVVLGLFVLMPISARAQGLGLGLGLIPPAKVYNHSLDSKLVAEVKGGNAARVQELLKQGADPNTKDTDTYTMPVLTLAAGQNENQDVLRVLLDAKADIEIKNSQGATPLVMTSVGHHPASMKALLKAGAKIEAPTSDGLTALMVSASAGELENVRILLAGGANVNALSNSKGTALIYGSAKTIAGTGNLEIIKILVEAGADVGVKAANGKTAITTAQNYGLNDIADYLTTIDTRDDNLFNAVARAYNDRKTPGSTAWEVVKTALDAGANPYYTIEDGRTSLMFLAYGIPGCDDATLKRFVDHSNIRAQEQQFGATALHLAVDNNNVALVTLLLKAGAPLDIRTKKGQTPLDMAQARKNKEIIALLEAASKPDDDDEDDTPQIPYYV